MTFPSSQQPPMSGPAGMSMEPLPVVVGGAGKYFSRAVYVEPKSRRTIYKKPTKKPTPTKNGMKLFITYPC